MFCTPESYADWVGSPYAGEAAATTPLLVVEGDATCSLPSPGALPVVVAFVGSDLGGDGPAGADLIVGPHDLAHLQSAVAQNPVACTSLAVLLRNPPSNTESGLAAESAVYSTLQAGPEFERWRQANPSSTPDDLGTECVVSAERIGTTLQICLDRPGRHNAFSVAMRDQLYEILAVAIVDDTVEHIELRGIGPSFCSGGDLAQFGSRPDPATAHVTRLMRSPARLLDLLSAKTTARIHGYALGGGIEMAAFAGEVVAHPDTLIGLPEPGLGLIPGAGGTVSITRRCGRWRTAALALATDTIDAQTALRWGLVDRIEPGGTT
ncbi:MAG: enoyl-CoA hydratase/isomerase family protein [Acidimicrobiales bacterium]|nr:enoyl-CoA hydratase/isomerase family protein [Acidimicrobiales bacterium]